MPERSEMTHQNWNKIQAAADGSRVLLTLLVTGDEQYAQAQLDRMSVEDLAALENWTGVLDTLVHYTRRRKAHEQSEGPAL